MLTVIETPEFIACAGAIWPDDVREEFIDWISENPEAGDAIPHTQGLRKVRWVAKGKGRKGGARVVYFVRTGRGELVLITVYTEGRIENIPAHLLRKLAEDYRV